MTKNDMPHDQRQYYRVDEEAQFGLSLVPEQQKWRVIDGIMQDSNTVPVVENNLQIISLSFGGCRLKTDQQLTQESGVDFRLTLTNEQAIRIFARVVDVKALSGPGSKLYEVAMQFQAMSEKANSTLYLFLKGKQQQMTRSNL